MIHAQTFVKSNAYCSLLLLFCLNVTCSFLFFSLNLKNVNRFRNWLKKLRGSQCCHWSGGWWAQEPKLCWAETGLLVSLCDAGLGQKCQQSTAQSSQDPAEIFPHLKQALGQGPGQRHRVSPAELSGYFWRLSHWDGSKALWKPHTNGHLHFPKYHHLFLCLLHQILSKLPKWNSFTTSRKIHRSRDYRIIFSDTDETCNFFLSKWEETYHCSSKHNWAWHIWRERKGVSWLIWIFYLIFFGL